ncbi:MAG TPA: glycoside hydrolase family 9 protein [Acetivibrio clariflavus]|nr:glycoside hydrolase family 9 protein [Acetivibrio clariflavus]
MKKTVSLLVVLAMLLAMLPASIVSAAGNFNYAEALQKAIYFYECQQAGPLPEWNRVEWRGDATMNDYVLGGWYDAGDHVKFNLPMSYSASMLGWALYEYGDKIASSGQKVHLENNLRFVLDYLVACDKGDYIVYQIGDGNRDHSWWGPVEVIEKEMERPYFTGKPTCVTAQMAAALAIGSIVLKDQNYLKHAKSLFELSDKTRSDADYKAAENFYKSHSGWKDELLWAAVWLYLATNDTAYLEKAESIVPLLNKQQQTDYIEYKWAHCWDDVHYGALLLLALITGKQEYHDYIQMHLDWWTVGFKGEKVKYVGDLAWLDSWGCLRYATTEAFLATVYADHINDATLKDRYQTFAKKQVDYALGSSGRSYVVGFGEKSPQHPHHRTAHGSWTDQMDNPPYHRHILYGALVGGPDSSGRYNDDIKDYVCNEVATDYNAGFVGALCSMYAKYGGTPLSNFPEPEEREDEFFVEGVIMNNNANDLSVKLLLNNRSGWPARMIKDLKYHYYVDLSEGVDPSDVTVSTNYIEANMDATVSQLIPYPNKPNIYYVEVKYKDGTNIYPGGQSEYSAELQLRLTAKQGSKWDPTNDPSFKGLGTGNTPVKSTTITVYDGDTLIFGTEPDGTTPSATPRNTPTQPTPTPTGNTVLKGDLDGDRDITSIDYAYLKMHLLGMSKLNDQQLKAADVDNNNTVDSIDLALIKAYLLGIIKSF